MAFSQQAPTGLGRCQRASAERVQSASVFGSHKYRPAWRFNPAVLTTTPSIASPRPNFQQYTGGGGASRGGGGAQPPPPPPPPALLAANALSPRRSAANGQQTGLAPAKTCARPASFRCKHHRLGLDSTAQQHACTVARGTIFGIQPHIAHRPHVRRTLARNAERHLRSFLGGSYCASHTAVQCAQGAPVHVQSALRNHTSERVTQSLRCTRGRTTSAARLAPPHAGQVPPTAGHLQSASDVRATATRSYTLGGGCVSRQGGEGAAAQQHRSRQRPLPPPPSHTAECGAQWTCPGATRVSAQVHTTVAAPGLPHSGRDWGACVELRMRLGAPETRSQRRTGAQRPQRA
jgi:hypothetical protein